MDIYIFCDLLYSEMIKNGVPEEKTARYIDNLRKNLTADDIAKVKESDIPRYAAICADNISKKASAIGKTENKSDSPAGDTAEAEPTVMDTENAPTVEIKKPVMDTENAPTVEVKKPETVVPSPEEEDLAEPHYEEPLPKATPKYVLVTVLLSPLWAVAAAIFMAPFIAMFAGEAALIAALILLLAGCCALGTAASLTGIIYGIIKMFSTPSVGLYEIGFGVIIAGVSMICGILIYNGAVRFVPWLFKKSGVLLKLAFKKVKPLLAKYRRWLVK